MDYSKLKAELKIFNDFLHVEINKKDNTSKLSELLLELKKKVSNTLEISSKYRNINRGETPASIEIRGCIAEISQDKNILYSALFSSGKKEEAEELSKRTENLLKLSRDDERQFTR